MDASLRDGRAAVDGLLASLETDTRRLGPDEWGFSIDEVGGWALHVGLALRGGLLRAQAEVAGPGQIDPGWLLRANRALPFVRFAHTGAGAVWIVGELPGEAATTEGLDRLLGVLVYAAAEARSRAG